MDPTTGLSDEDLCRHHLAGDRSAFGQLVERFSTPLYRYAYRFTRNADDAEDMVQETFIRFERNLPKLDLERPVRPWLYHVCTNLCRNLAAKKKSLLFSDLEREDEEGEGIVATFADHAESAMEHLDRAADIQAVRAAIAILPEKYRVVLALFYFDALSYEEIAAALTLPLNTVRTHLRRAKEALAKALHDGGFSSTI